MNDTDWPAPIDWADAMEATMIGVRLRALDRDRRGWSHRTFGPPAQRGPVGPLKHLAKEAGEAAAAWVGMADGAYRKELADILILWLDAIDRSHLTVADVVGAAEAKMAENKARQWPAAAGGDEPVEHLR